MIAQKILIVYLITVVCSLATRTLLLRALLTAGVAALVVLEASLTVEGAVDVLRCCLALAVVLYRTIIDVPFILSNNITNLAMTKVCDKHFEELALREGEFLDPLPEEVLLVHRVPVLLPA